MRQVKKETEKQPLVVSEHRIYLDSVINMREIGGYINEAGMKLREGRLIRSGELCSATYGDLKQLAGTYHVGLVIDLRPEEAVNSRPDQKISGAGYVNLPLFSSEYPAESVTSMYSEIMFGERAKQSLLQLFNILVSAEEKRPILFHDTSGVDETGVVTALMLSILGFSDEFILEEYMLSGKSVVRVPSGALINGGVSIHTYALEYVLSRARVEYGSVNEYIRKEIGIGKDNMKKLKNMYLI